MSKTAQQTVVGRLSKEQQAAMVASVRDVVAAAPLFRPTAGSLPMSVRITNAGDVGWVADEQGYRYQAYHPKKGPGHVWPAIPEEWKVLADEYDYGAPWDCAHIVRYPPGASLGWHRDKTEHDRSYSIVTFSLGDPAEWWVREEEGATATRTTIYSGDIVLLSPRQGTRDYLHRIAKVDNAGDMLHPSPLDKPGRLAVSLRVGGHPRTA